MPIDNFKPSLSALVAAHLASQHLYNLLTCAPNNFTAAAAAVRLIKVQQETDVRARKCSLVVIAQSQLV